MIPGALSVRNSVPVPIGSVPVVPFNDFCIDLRQRLATGHQVVAYFGFQAGTATRLISVLSHHPSGHLFVYSCDAGHTMPSLSTDFPQLQLFEREIAEQFGIVFTGHPWFKPVRYHKPFSPAKDLFGQQIGNTDYFAMEGEEIHEVGVGPVHAGVIEPGHFRFQCHGETVYHLEISLGYQHRGIEAALINGPHTSTRFMIESAAGDTTAGHTIAYCQLMESLASCHVSPRAHALRAIALELERCANHIGDIGALSGDVGFLPTASFCGRIRGDALNATAILCGSRFGRSFVREGGVCFDLEKPAVDRLIRSIGEIRKDFTNAADLLLNAPSVLARFENTGMVTVENCRRLGLVGPAARACGCSQDIRQDFPSGYYQFAHIPIVSNTHGDVFARAFVRYGEVLRSLDFIEDLCRHLPVGDMITPLSPLSCDSFVVSLTEGWRGAVCHAAITDNAGRFARYKIVDPSFHNWSGLSLALRGQQISDFPLINKSFNLSYCGYDL